MGCFAGIDIGASSTKAIIINDNTEVLGYSVNSSGADFQGAADRAYNNARKEAGLSDSEKCVVTTTGYGRRNVPYADSVRTEISCHAAGSFHHFPKAHTLIDIGGQDSKLIKIDSSGVRTSFKMNRKCAAGTGAFLEEVAYRMEIKLEQLNELAGQAERDVPIGSYCTVFTVTEILARIREGVSVAEIIRGIFTSVLKRIQEMDVLDGDVAMTGGVVAHNPILVKMFEDRIGKKVFVPPLPQLAGAFGAALYSLSHKGGQDA